MKLLSLLSIVGPARSLLLTFALALTIGAAVLDAILVATAVPLASELLSGDASGIFNSGQTNLHNPLVLALLAIIGKNILQIASTYVISRTSFAVITDGTLRVFRSTLDRSTLTGMNSGEQQASVITEPVHLVLNVVNPLISLAGNLTTVFVLLLTVTVVISPQLFPLIGIFLLLFSAYTLYSRLVMRKSGEARRKAEAQRTGFARSALKANGEIGYSSWALGTINRFLRRPTKMVERAVAVKWYFTESYKNVLELTIVVSAALFFLLFNWRENSALLSELAALAVAAVRLAPAVNRSMVNFQTLQFGLPSLHALTDVWHPVAQGKGFGRYEAALQHQVRGIDIRLRSGEKTVACIPLEPGLVVLTGESGIGKTSLLLQIAEHVRDRNLGYLAFVSQDVLVLPAPLHDNIYVAPDRVVLNAAIARAVLDLADQHDSVLSRSRVLADDGRMVDAATLSGGQARRLALMRALASNPDILIADEPTSGLHHDMSVALVSALREYAATHIVVVATHDANLIAAATAVIEL